MSTRDNTATAEGNGQPEGWEWPTLGDVSEKPQYGWTTKANHDTGKLKLLRTTDITSGTVDWSTVPFCTDEPEDVEKYLVESGDVLISRAGSVGVSFLINKPERAVFASYLIRFRPKAGIDTKYFYYYLKSPAYWEAIGASKSGIAVPNVNASKLAQVPIPIAPLDQQKRIVAEIEKQFSHLDEAVADLKRYKAAALKAAVEGRLAEAEAELARREGRTYETGAQLLQRILETRRGQWKGKGKYKEPAAPDTTDLPELSTGWAWATCAQLGRLQLGQQCAPKYHAGPNMRPYLRVQNVFEDRINLSDVMDMDFSQADFEKYRLAPGDMPVNEGQSLKILGRPAIYRGELSVACFTNTLIRFRAIKGISIEFTLLLSRHNMHSGRFVTEWMITTNIAHLSLGRLSAVGFPLPPEAEQKRIVSEVAFHFSLLYEIYGQVDANLIRADRLH